jgi:hypothetical protein
MMRLPDPLAPYASLIKWGLIALLALGVVGSVLWYGHSEKAEGKAEVQAQWDAQKARDEAEIARLTALRAKVTVKVETVYVDRVQVVREKARAIETVREVFVPVDSGELPGGFRLFFDAAITGSIPESASITDAAPVPIADVADTHAVNTERCHIAYETVAAWQAWATQQAAVK